MATYNGRVTGGGLNLRQSASTSSTRLIQIPNNTAIVVSNYSSNSTWLCTTYNGYSGFVMAQYVTILSAVAQRTVTVSGNQPLRRSPNASDSTLIQVPNGTQLTVQTHNSTWSSATYGNYQGFIQSQYLTEGSSSGGTGGSGGTGNGTTTDSYSITATVDTNKFGTGGYVNMRSGAYDSASIVTTIPDGSTVKVSSLSGTWLQVKYGGYTGYVMAKFIMGSNAYGGGSTTPGGTTPVETGDYSIAATVDTDKHGMGGTVNMRATASETASIVTAIPDGATVMVKSLNGTWLAVKYNGYTGYVMGKFIMGSSEYGGLVMPTDGGVISGYAISATVDTKKQGTGGSTMIQASASTSAAGVITVPDGAVIKVKSLNGTWLEAQYNSRTGYIQAKYVMGATEYEKATATTAGQIYVRTIMNTFIRSAATVGNNALAAVPKGQKILCTALTNNWYRTTYNGQAAYVSAYCVMRLDTRS